MTEIDVPDWVVQLAVDEMTRVPPESEGQWFARDIEEVMRACITAALGAWVVREGYIAGPELCGLDAARQLGTKFYGTVWSEPTGQAGTPLYTLRQEKPE